MRAPTDRRFVHGAWLFALLVTAVPHTAARAQRGPIVPTPQAGALGSWRPNARDRVEPYRLRLGLAPDDATYARDLPTPPTSSLLRRVAGAARIAPRVERTPAVACPMPVSRIDSAAVASMPRVDTPLRDEGGVAVPSCTNPLDVR